MNDTNYPEVTKQLAAIVNVLRTSKMKWNTAIHVSSNAGVSSRTTRHHIARLVKLNLVKMADVNPAPGYAWIVANEKDHPEFIAKLNIAMGMFGIQ